MNESRLETSISPRRERQNDAGPLTEREEVIHRIFQTLWNGPLAIFITRIRDGLIVEANNSFLRLVNYSREEIVGRSTLELGILVDPDDRERAARARREDGTVQDFEIMLRTKEGEIRHVLATMEMIELDGRPCFLRMAYDITERKLADERLLQEAYHNAFHDALTGLPNRALFMDRLGRALERTKRRSNYFFAVLFLDIDRFKNINDSFGHVVGDHLLAAAARRLEPCVRTGDTVAHLGGDEFAILVDEINDISDALRVAERIRKSLDEPFELDGHQLNITASIGIALSEPNYVQSEEILYDADKAMYRAKAKGRARHELFNREMHNRAVARLKLESDLRFAIKNHRFQIHYQPIISLETGRISGFEALGRWHHPERGLISPIEFIPMAEETGLIVDYGRWMLREACQQVHEWQDRYGTPDQAPLGISVNFSNKQISQPDLVDQLYEILKVTGLAARALCLEVTEGTITENPESRAARLAELRALGVRVYVDNFGTGHSSLNVMYRYPIDGLKIARSFINRMGANGENSEIVRTIVMLARDFGMDVTAEGVETAEQVAQLKALRCKFGQGYYFAEPMGAEAVEDLLARQPQW